ncbi:MAG: hypothetical protein LLG16_04120 [Euryarchaeota archaeon]|nr:hypothetical protein [Euryarchaeota archaeon]
MLLPNDIVELDMRYAKKIESDAAEVIEKAEKHFSKAGLKVTDRSESRICMENEEGFVTVQVRVMTTGELDIITEGFDVRVKQFLTMVR